MTGAVAQWDFEKADGIVSFVPDPLDDTRLFVFSSADNRIHLVEANSSGTLAGQSIKCASGPPREADGPPRAILRRPARLTRAPPAGPVPSSRREDWSVMGSVGKNGMTLVGDRVFVVQGGSQSMWIDIFFIEAIDGSWDSSTKYELWRGGEGSVTVDSSVTEEPTFTNTAVIGASAAHETPPAPSVERLLIAVGPAAPLRPQVDSMTSPTCSTSPAIRASLTSKSSERASEEVGWDR